jgi:signal transduction histidine kinase
VNELIQEILGLRSQLDHWKDIELRTALDPDLPSIVGSRTDLRQVFFNLVTNAEDAVHQLDGATIEVSSERTDSGIRVSVSDSGSGISADMHQRIFDPFYTTKDPDKGTGLGLSLSHGVVAEMGGKIWVEDSPLGGARFVVDLPFAADR